MRKFNFYCCLFILLAIACNIQTAFSPKNNKPVLHKIDEENGLSDNNVQCIYKDRNNFVRVGIASGLNLMDGSDITIFRHEEGNQNSLNNNNNITVITGDTNGLLWTGTRVPTTVRRY